MKVYENNGWTKLGENSGLVLMIIDNPEIFHDINLLQICINHV